MKSSVRSWIGRAQSKPSESHVERITNQQPSEARGFPYYKLDKNHVPLRYLGPTNYTHPTSGSTEGLQDIHQTDDENLNPSINSARGL